MVKTFSTALVCGLALIGQSYAQEVFIGTQKTKPKSPPLPPVVTDQVKVEKAIAVQPPKSGAPASDVSAAKTSAAAKQGSSVASEKKSSTAVARGAKVAGPGAAKGTTKSVAASAASHETALHSETKSSGAIKPVTSKAAPTVTIHSEPALGEKKSGVATNDSLSKPAKAEQAKVTAKTADTVAAPDHLTNSLKTDGTAALPLAAVPPPSKSKAASLSQSTAPTIAKSLPANSSKAKKVATEATSGSVSPSAPKPEIAAIHATKPAGTAANKSAAVVIKHPGVITAPEKMTEASTTTLAKSSSQKGPTVQSSPASGKTDTSVKTGGEKSRAMIAGMIAAQAEKQSIASVNPIIENPAAESTIPQPVNNHFDTAFTKLADGFDFPIGKPDAEGYYKARGFRSHGHLGEDWDGVRGGDTDLGDPIYSVADGLVVFARDCHMGWGNVLIVRHSYREGGTVKTVDALYGHLNSMLVHRGQAITRGQKIATMGNAHGLYDAHLHLEIRKNLEIGMSRAAFAQDFSNYYEPTQFIQAHRHLQAGGGTYRVAMNTFTRDARIRWDKTRNYSRAHTGGGSSESAAALKRALAAKH